MTARVLIDGHMLGAGETGNETYVRGLLSGLCGAGAEGVGRRHRTRPWTSARTSAWSCPAARTSPGSPPASSRRRETAARTSSTPPTPRRSRPSPRACSPSTSCRSCATRSGSRCATSWCSTPGVRASVPRAARVLVPSGHARDELCALLGVVPERVVVTPEGVDRALRGRCRETRCLPRRSTPPPALGLRRPYVLAIGQPPAAQERAPPARGMGAAGRRGRRRRSSSGHRRRLPRPQGRRSCLRHHGRHRRPRRLPRLRARRRPPRPLRRRGALRLPVAVRGLGLPVLEAMACRHAGRLLGHYLPAGGRRPARPRSSTRRTRAPSPPCSAR